MIDWLYRKLKQMDGAQLTTKKLNREMDKEV